MDLFRRRKTTTEIVTLGRAELEELVAAFERNYGDLTGTNVSSLDVYNRYRSGELDDPYVTAWTDYYVAFLRASGNAELAPRANGRAPWVAAILEATQPPVTQPAVPVV